VPLADMRQGRWGVFPLTGNTPQPFRFPQSPALHPQLGGAARAVRRQSPPELFPVNRKQL